MIFIRIKNFQQKENENLNILSLCDREKLSRLKVRIYFANILIR